MSNFEDFKTFCRKDLMQVELAIVKTSSTLLARKPTYVAIDGGAHTGYHTTRLARYENCAKVYAIEADPFTLVKLREKLEALEPAHRAKVEIVEAAVQEDPDKTEITWMSSSSHPGRSGVSSIWQKDESVQFRDSMTVPAVTVDTLVRGSSLPVSMIKMDLEGGDYMALRGAAATLKKDRPLVVFENSVRAPELYGFTIPQFIDYFASVGYSPVSFGGDIPTAANWFQFWEMWAAPTELADALRARINEVVETALKSGNRS